MAPGCYDALGATLIEQAGFDACYMTGFGSAASLLGQPDIGLLSAAEMTDNARRIAAATRLPVIADADTGYGNPLNVMRTVREYERAGVAALQLEDQVAPKRCGHMEEKAVVPPGEMVQKIQAAVEARHDRDLVIVGRTDARAVEGLPAAIERAHVYAEAGADLLFIEAPASTDELEQIAVAGLPRPLVYNLVDGGKTPVLSASEVAELGFALLLVPIATLLHATAAMRQALSTLRRDGLPEPVPALDGDGDDPFAAFTDLIGLPAALELQRRFTD